MGSILFFKLMKLPNAVFDLFVVCEIFAIIDNLVIYLDGFSDSMTIR
jgi:hypothetical protein